jgi:DNA-binding response OmpR family regulator
MKQERYHIVMVDDDAEDVFTIRKALSGEDFDVEFTEISQSRKLMPYLAERGDKRPDLILLDINMPRMNGFEVLQELKTHDEFATIPVVMLSTSSQDADRVKSLKMGAADFVTKFSSLKQLQSWTSKLKFFLQEE